jgi:hypothetical protein
MMREYAVVSPTFWTGKTGRQIRLLGPDAQIVAMYLITSPHSNMIGLYYLPVLFISHETGLTIEGASKALRSLIEAQFCAYDEQSETVFVYEMAKFQIGTKLSAQDKRVKGVENELAKINKCPLLQMFLDRYAECFNLDFHVGNSSPIEAPSKPHRSQDQDQDQDQEVEPAAKTFSLLMADGTNYIVPQSVIMATTAAYPLVNIPAELLKMSAWLVSNPGKRKKDAPKFINNWLKGEQRKAEESRAKTALPQTTGRTITETDCGVASWVKSKVAV